MRILIISDSHGLEINNEIINFEQCDYQVHCGDSQLMMDNQEMKQFNLMVRGNCDFDQNYPLEAIKEINGLRLMASHGHCYGVNYSLSQLRDAALKQQIDIVFYGHTHVVNVNYENGVLIVNPGSIRQSRSSYPETYMLLEVTAQEFIITIKNAKTYQVVETKKITK